MRYSLFPVATAILGAALLTPTYRLQAQASASTTPTTTHHHVKHPIKKKGPTLEEQIQSLRQDMQQQVQTLQQQLTASQSQLQAAQASAAAAQASAQQAQQASAQQAQTLTDNTAAVSSLQGAVTDLKTSSSSMQTMVTESEAKVQKQITHPDEIHYKGVTLTPKGSFVAAETTFRTRATGSDIPTPFTSVPLENTDQSKLTEFFATARQSRMTLQANAKTEHVAYTGHWEMDWLGTGVTSNNNQSNSYVLRERVLWGQAALNSGLVFSAGQTWSLATEYRKGLGLNDENVPLTIDPNYNTGFVWARQYGFRMTKNFGSKFAMAASAEAPQTLALSGSGLPSNYLIGSAGTGGGLYNSGGQPGATSSANLANYSFNVAPDLLMKAAFDPSFGHFEIFGIARIFRNRIYPGITYVTTSYCVNTTTGVVVVTTSSCPTGTVSETTSVAATGTTAGAFNDKTVGGGVGGSMRLSVTKHFDIGVKGLWGDGVGRYGASQIGDATLRPNSQLALLHGFSALGTLEFHVTPRLELYGYYGGDEDFRRYFFTNSTNTKAEGYGSPLANESGCFTEPAPATTPTAGFTPGSQSNCTANTRAAEEGTLGYWYDFYKGEKGRFRQGIQYSYVDRLIWSGAANTTGGTPRGNDNVFETSFRYYLP